MSKDGHKNNKLISQQKGINMEQITVIDALDIVASRVQWLRRNGESDMRSILNTVRLVRRMVNEGKSRDEILAEFNDDDADE